MGQSHTFIVPYISINPEITWLFIFSWPWILISLPKSDSKPHLLIERPCTLPSSLRKYEFAC